MWFRDWIMAYSDPTHWPLEEAAVYSLIGFVLVLFVLLSAIPFVPGVEIGFILLVVFGAKIALWVYCAMVVALHLSYFAGRFVSPTLLARLFGSLHMSKVCALIHQMEELDEVDRLDYLLAHMPTRIRPFLQRYQSTLLLLLLNMPGNFLIGGGGGIGFVVGASRIYAPGSYSLSVFVAVAPIPLIFLVLGSFG